MVPYQAMSFFDRRAGVGSLRSLDSRRVLRKKRRKGARPLHRRGASRSKAPSALQIFAGPMSTRSKLGVMDNTAVRFDV